MATVTTKLKIAKNESAAVVPADRVARHILLNGGVQGLGVRPAIFRLAKDLGLDGAVRNSSRGVEIEVEGNVGAVREFECRLLCALPQPALVSELTSEIIAATGRKDFTIIKEAGSKQLGARVPEDRGLCADCAREIFQEDQRRCGYPFTSCTQCGPRYTVVRAMPFERNDTVMDRFPLCAACEKEYHNAADRRFHAQIVACPSCGPSVAFARSGAQHPPVIGADAILYAVDALRSGEVLAIKGLGGYQLLVDATNHPAVERLRERKARPSKPFAVMVETEAAAAALCHLDTNERAAFSDAAAPIVLARKHTGARIAPAVALRLDSLGVMRPTTPLHALLLSALGRPIICTSANREGAPLEYVPELAGKNLAEVADVWLEHNREIVRPIDDSVVRVIAGKRATVRLARGLAPLTLDLPPMHPMLALGGHMKAAVAWSNGVQSVLGPHIGDLETLPARERYLAHVKDMLRLYQFRPQLLVHDLHPDYFTSQWAARQSIPRLAVQHHHAHVAAGMLLHGWLDRRVLGVAWDGTGYGTDGTIWGGEFLVCAGGEFERVGRIRPFTLPGGDAAIRKPWRTAVSVCSQLEDGKRLAGHPGWQVDELEKRQVAQLATNAKLSPYTSSAGRLIDAAAALILGIDHVDYEGAAAMQLEAAADRDARGWYHFPVEEDDLQELDWRPLFQGLIEDLRHGTDVGTVAMKFHRSLAHGIVGVCRRWSELPVVLCGGVFQNKLLTELVAEMQGGCAQPLGLPGIIPVNDGGLAAGQLVIAAAKRRCKDVSRGAGIDR